ncbi:mucin-5AC-like [Macrobrachium nipponense]|uniref:mucin-5AC-like n=1 Tax=Macrobrachium nipponense TaxID=159736 RepID=UPI0030C87E43
MKFSTQPPEETSTTSTTYLSSTSESSSSSSTTSTVPVTSTATSVIPTSSTSVPTTSTTTGPTTSTSTVPTSSSSTIIPTTSTSTTIPTTSTEITTSSATSTETQTPTTASIVPFLDEGVDVDIIVQIHEQVDEDCADENMNKTQEVVLDNTFHEDDLSSVLNRLQESENGFAVAETIITQNISALTDDSFWYYTSSSGTFEVTPNKSYNPDIHVGLSLMVVLPSASQNGEEDMMILLFTYPPKPSNPIIQIMLDTIVLNEGCHDGSVDCFGNYSWPEIIQRVNESVPDLDLNTSTSSLTEHIQMLSGVQPFERKYVNITDVTDIEEIIDCPPEETSTTSTTYLSSTSESSSSSSTTSTVPVTSTATSVIPTSSTSVPATSTTTGPTTSTSTVPTSSSSTIIPTTSTSTTIPTTSTESTTSSATSTETQTPTTTSIVPFLDEGVDVDVIVQIHEQVDEDCADENMNKTQEVVLDNTFHEDELSSVLNRLQESENGFAVAETIITQNISALTDDSLWYYTSSSGTFEVTPNKSYSPDIHVGLSLMVVLPTASQNGEEDMMILLFTYPPKPSNPIIQIMLDTIVLNEGCHDGSVDCFGNYSWPEIIQRVNESVPDLDMKTSTSSLTEHIQMLSGVQPFKRKYVNITNVEDIEEKIDCPPEETSATSTTYLPSTSESSSSSISTTTSVTPSSSTSVPTTSTTTGPTTSTSTVPTTSSSATVLTTSTSTIVPTTSTEGTTSAATTSTETQTSTTANIVPFLDEDVDVDVIVQIHEQVGDDCDDENINKTQEVVLDSTLHEEDFSRVLKRLHESENGFAVAESIITQNISALNNDSFWYYTSSTGTFEVTPNKSYSPDIHMGLSLMVVLPSVSQNGEGDMIILLLTYPPKPSNPIIQVMLDTLIFSEGCHNESANCSTNYSWPRIMQRFNETVLDLDLNTSTSSLTEHIQMLSSVQPFERKYVNITSIKDVEEEIDCPPDTTEETSTTSTTYLPSTSESSSSSTTSAVPVTSKTTSIIPTSSTSVPTTSTTTIPTTISTTTVPTSSTTAGTTVPSESTTSSAATTTETQTPTTTTDVPFLDEHVDVIVQIHEQVDADCDEESMNKTQEVVLENTFHEDDLSRVLKRLQESENGFSVAETIITQNISSLNNDSFWYYTSYSGSLEVVPNKIMLDTVVLSEGCHNGSADCSTNYAWPKMMQKFNESVPDLDLNTSTSSLTEHIEMLSSVQPFERKYVNITSIKDIEEEIDCPPDTTEETSTTSTTYLPSTSESSSSSTTSAVPVTSTTTSIIPTSSTSVLTTSTTTGPTTSTSTVPKTSSSTTISTTTSTTTVLTTTSTTTVPTSSTTAGTTVPSENTTSLAATTTTKAQAPTTTTVVPLLDEHIDVIVQIHEQVDADCDEESMNKTQEVVLENTFHEDDLSRVLERLQESENGFSVAESIITQNISSLHNDSFWYYTSNSGTLEVAPNKSYSHDIHIGLSLMVVLPSASQNGEEDMIVFLLTYPAKPSNPIIQIMLDTVVLSEGFHNGSADCSTNYSLPKIMQKFNESVNDLDLNTSTSLTQHIQMLSSVQPFERKYVNITSIKDIGEEIDCPPDTTEETSTTSTTYLPSTSESSSSSTTSAVPVSSTTTSIIPTSSTSVPTTSTTTGSTTSTSTVPKTSSSTTISTTTSTTTVPTTTSTTTVPTSSTTAGTTVPSESSTSSAATTTTKAQAPTTTTVVPLFDEHVDVIVQIHEQVDADCDEKSMNKTQEVVLENTFHEDDLSRVLKRLQKSENGFSVAETIITQNISPKNNDSFWYYTSNSGTLEVAPNKIMLDTVVLSEGCHNGSADCSTNYSLPKILQKFNESVNDLDLNTSTSSLTEHIQMLSSVQPFERKYVNITSIKDIEEEIDCPPDTTEETSTTSTTYLPSTSESSSSSTTSAVPVTSTTTSIRPTSSISVPTTSTTTGSTTSSSTVPKTSSSTTISTTTSSTTVPTATSTTTVPTTSTTAVATIPSQSTTSSVATTTTEAQTTTTTVVPLLDEHVDVIVQIHEQVDADCDEESMNKTQEVVLENTFHEDDLSRVLKRLQESENGFSVAETIITQNISSLNNDSFWYFTSYSGTLEVAPNKSYSHDIHIGLSLMVVLPSVSQNGDEDMIIFLLTYPAKPSNPIIQIMLDTVVLSEGCHNGSADCSTNYSLPKILQKFNESVPDLDLNTSTSSLTEHIQMLSSVQPFERKYVNITSIRDIEEEIDCPPDTTEETSTTSTTYLPSTSESSTSSTTSAVPVTSTTTSIRPTSSISVPTTSTTTGSTTSTFTVPKTSSSTTISTTTSSPTVPTATSTTTGSTTSTFTVPKTSSSTTISTTTSSPTVPTATSTTTVPTTSTTAVATIASQSTTSSVATTTTEAQTTTTTVVPLLDEHVDVIVQIHEQVDADCDEESMNKTQEVVLENTFHEDDLSRVLKRLSRSKILVLSL